MSAARSASEYSLTTVEVRAADTQIEQDRHDSLASHDVDTSDDFRDVLEAALHDADPIPEGCECRARRCHGDGIPIDTEETKIRAGGQERTGVATATHRRVHDQTRRHLTEKLGHLCRHHRHVEEALSH